MIFFSTVYLIIFISYMWSDDSLIDKGVQISSDGHTHFSLLAPAAREVNLILFSDFTNRDGMSYSMHNNGNNFSLEIEKDLVGMYYGYQIINKDVNTQEFPPYTIIADPYSRALATQNHYAPVNKTLIINDNFDWEGVDWLQIPHRDLIIYEIHLKDMTAHPSSNCKTKGAYAGFHDKDQKGGIQHIRDMGYNAVEFLPLFEFGNVELPFGDTTQAVTNTWNPYATNHWGYMPSFFFAPEGNYASDADLSSGVWNGTKGLQIKEFKELVKALHQEGIAVIMDVVYNHVSQYDNNPLKQIQKKEYFRQNNEGTYSSESGCGNDLETENEDIRQMIIESVLFWMREYHIDGFRFDLGKLIDWQTIEIIREKAQELNPGVFLTCEPWGGDGYDPNGFSDRGWSSWNDQFRNALKGWHPDGDIGFIFGNWHHDFDLEKIKRVFAGSPRALGGQYTDIAHSVNYLESHDDHTLGDFIRIATGKVGKDEIISDINTHAQLSEKEIAIHKLSAMALLTSQGAVMIAQGQEWGRSKVIIDTEFPDENVGKIDHNSYDKDNETNWLNWNHKDLNAELVDFYRHLIKLRKDHPAFRRASIEDITFIGSSTSHSIAFHIHIPGEKQAVVFLNSDPENYAEIKLPKGKWEVIIKKNHIIYSSVFDKGNVSLNPVSCSLYMQ